MKTQVPFRAEKVMSNFLQNGNLYMAKWRHLKHSCNSVLFRNEMRLVFNIYNILFIKNWLWLFP
uniref:Uncharacterized protein n=1 Tax=Rhizophora mucronata TaxID=61149 RepID=A0A2P2LFF3_RHIMU